jgi:hypothetical protein
MAVSRRFIWFFTSLTIAGIAAFLALVWIVRKPAKPDHVPGESIEAVDESAVVSPKPPTPLPLVKGDVRSKVRVVVEQDSQSVPKLNLPDYLELLLTRARSQGQITALEANVGVEMIKRLGGGPEMLIEFTSRLNVLAQELRHEKTSPSPAQVTSEVSALADQIAVETTPENREALISKYVEKSRFLDPEQRIEATARLNQMVIPAGSTTPNETIMAERWATVERTQGEARQTAINQLVEGIRQLPPEQQVEHTQRLNMLTAQARAQTP